MRVLRDSQRAGLRTGKRSVEKNSDSSATFLTEPELRQRIVDLLRVGKRADMAVAFWGRTALEMLQPKRGSRVICDLLSGACDPDEIKRLMEHGVEVKWLNRLHAKMYLTKSELIVGSANASINGLGEEGIEGRGSIEAAVVTCEPAALKAARIWFEDQWKLANSVEPRHLKLAKAAFKKHRGSRPLRERASLLTLLRNEPERFRDRPVRLCVWNAEADDWALALNKEERARRSRDTIKGKSATEAAANNDYFYQDDKGWDVGPGEIIVDYWVDPQREHVEYQGIFQVLSEDPFVRKSAARFPRVVLLSKAKSIPGVVFPPSEQRELGSVLLRYLAEEHIKPDKNEFYIDMPLNRLACALGSRLQRVRGIT